jgi:biopolymer transport protein ExbD
MEFRPRKDFQVRLDISALIDVVFLLLIFFAISTTFLETSGIPLELPESSSRSERSPEDLTIALSADGRIQFRGEVVDLERLEALLPGALDDSDTRQVTIRADENARHGRVIAIMDLARRAGAAGLTVATEEPADAPGD